MSERIDMVKLLKDLRSGILVTCPICKEGQLTPIGDYKTTHGFVCSKCPARLNID